MKLFGVQFGKTVDRPAAAQPAFTPAVRDVVLGPNARVDVGTYKQLMSSLGQTAEVKTDRPKLDIEHHKFGVEIEVAAPKGIDEPFPPPTAAMVQKLIDKGYNFTVGGYASKGVDGHTVLEGGRPETQAQNILDIAEKDPGSLNCTDPHTHEPRGFSDTQDPAVNTQLFHRYVKFKTFMEDKVRPEMDAMGWDAEDTVTCQAHAGVTEPVRYIEVKNRISTIADGGMKDIRHALTFLKSIGCTEHKACALQYHLDLRSFSPEDRLRIEKNLMRVELENENILYRIAQNGEAQHRGIFTEGGPFRFCQSLASQPLTPCLSAETPDQLKDLWYNKIFLGAENAPDPVERPTGPYHYSRYYGINFHSAWYRGSAEVRHPGTTLDPDVAETHLDLALGLLAAAHNQDKYDWQGMHPLDFNPETATEQFQVANDAPVSSEQMKHFLDRTVGENKDSRQRILDLFLRGGGRISDAPAADPAIVQADDMLHHGYTMTSRPMGLAAFHPQDGVEAVDGLRHMNIPLEIQAPGENPVLLDSTQGLNEFLVAHR
ncbi:MAG TPA: amidoligase family protein [Candidatus Xenobia bacterium]|jgi:hypothetical protein